MGREEILKKLADHFSELQKFGVSAIFIFGSVARDEMKAGSDIDILVEFDEVISLFEFIRLKNHLAELLGANIDLVSRDALRPELKKRIEKEAIRAA